MLVCADTFAGRSSHAASMAPAQNGKHIGPLHYRTTSCTGSQKPLTVPPSDFSSAISLLGQTPIPTLHSPYNQATSMVTLGHQSRGLLLGALHMAQVFFLTCMRRVAVRTATHTVEPEAPRTNYGATNSTSISWSGAFCFMAQEVASGHGTSHWDPDGR